MDVHPLDGYLLEGRPAKAQAIAVALQQRSDDERVAPFYRALESVGARVADEALIALRLALAGKAPDDDAVRRVRGLVALVAARDAKAVDAAFARAGTTLMDLAPFRHDPITLAAAAREAYAATF